MIHYTKKINETPTNKYKLLLSYKWLLLSYSILTTINLIQVTIIMIPMLSIMPLEMLYQHKGNIYFYFTSYFSIHSNKIILVIAQLMLLSTTIILSAHYAQRFNVPELNKEKRQNHLLMLSNTISFMTILLLIYDYPFTVFISIKCNLRDNLVYLAYLLSTYAYCCITFIFHNTLNRTQYIKFLLLSIMTINVFVYLFALILVSFYQPIILIELYSISVLMLCLNVSSYLFHITLILFIPTLCLDFNCLTQSMEATPEIEFFVDINDLKQINNI